MPPQASEPAFEKPRNKTEYMHEALLDDALKAYRQPDTGASWDSSLLGAAATAKAPVTSPADYAVSYEKIELTLEQLGANIERMRADALGKPVNAPVEHAQTSAQADSVRPFTRPVQPVNMNPGTRADERKAA